MWDGPAYPGYGHYSASFHITNDGYLVGYGFQGYGQFGNAWRNYPDGNAPTVLNSRYSNKLKTPALAISASGFTTLVIYNNSLSCFGLLSTEPLSCSMHGSCVAADVCSCDAGYSGYDCSTFVCNGVVASSGSACSGKGTCVSLNTCVCEIGYAGPDCEAFIAGSVYAFGNNMYYQLGGQTLFNGVNPVKVYGHLTDKLVNQVASMDSANSALATDGSYYLWGANLYFFPIYGTQQLAPGLSFEYFPRPYPYQSGTAITHIFGSAYSFHFLSANRTLINMFGMNTGAVANNDWGNYLVTSLKTTSLPSTTFKKVCNGLTFAAFLTSNGTVKTWGSALYGVSLLFNYSNTIATCLW
jgi:hypothetical protein